MIETMSPKLQEEWQELGYKQPTAIQEKSYALLRNKQDVLGVAPTGSGKTLAYLLPLLENVEAIQQLQVAILVPSQELAGQVGAVVRQWAATLNLKSQTLVGGANVKRQIINLKKQPQIVVGTPGRMTQLAELKKLKLHNVNALIIDEADVMLDDEHKAETQAFISKLPKYHQTGFFSATVTDAVKHQVDQMSEYVETIEVDALGEGFIQRRKHGYMEVPVRKRSDLLRRLAQVDGMQALVFVRTIAEIEALQTKLSFHQIRTGQLHSNLTGQARQQTLSNFRRGELEFLFTTDVAARGMDIEDLPYVIQYDLAYSSTEYTHRSGRTARMDKEGLVLSFVNERSLRELKQQVGPNTELDQYVVRSRELLTISEAKVLAEERHGDSNNETNEEITPKVKATKPKKKTVQTVELTKKKKKQRQRNQKNKGARGSHKA